MSQELLRSLVWLDYRLALLFTVVLPLILLGWVTYKRREAMQRLLIIYWRVSSLLAITVYLMIGDLPIAFLTGLIARILIPIGLWFWNDANEEIEDQPSSSLKLSFTAWRWAISIYSVIGAASALPFLQCAFAKATYETAFCQVWREPPLIYKDILHATYTTGFLAFFGILGLVIYTLYLMQFVLVRLGREGRQAMDQ